MYKDRYSNKFDWFSYMALAIISIGLAAYAIYITGGSGAMTQPLPPEIAVIFVLGGTSLGVAIYNGIRMMLAPKDDRLDNLITRVDNLTEKVDNLLDKDTANKLISAIQELTQKIDKETEK